MASMERPDWQAVMSYVTSVYKHFEVDNTQWFVSCGLCASCVRVCESNPLDCQVLLLWIDMCEVTTVAVQATLNRVFRVVKPCWETTCTSMTCTFSMESGSCDGLLRPSNIADSSSINWKCASRCPVASRIAAACLLAIFLVASPYISFGDTYRCSTTHIFIGYN